MWNRTDPAAGRSTREYYEKRLRAWRRSNRGPFVVAIAMGVAFAFPLWLYAPHGEFYAGMVIGSFLGMISWVRDDPPEFIAKFKRGSDGERQTARALGRLKSAGWYAFHDRTTGRGNLDHVAVGPGGVFLLESTNLNGTISVDESGLTAAYGDASIDSFTNHKLAGAVTSLSIALRDRVAAATGLTYFVPAVVVIWGHFPQGLVRRGSVTYIAGDQLADWLKSRPQRVCQRDVNLIRLALTADAVVPPASALDAPSA